MNILCNIVKVKTLFVHPTILHVFSLFARPPVNSCRLISLEWLAHFEHVVQSLADTCLSSDHFKIHT